MFNATRSIPRRFSQFNSPEHAAWRRHRQLLLQIRARDVWRGCMGLALITTHPSSGVVKPGRLFVPDEHVRWVSLVDIPRHHFRLRRPREVHWAAVYRTRVRHGMPTIGGDVDAAYDFRIMPFDRIRHGAQIVEHGPDALDPVESPDLFRVLNAVNWAMTGTAFFCRAAWRARREGFLESIPKNLGHEAGVLPFGDGRQQATAKPATWMPRAYLAFRDKHRDKVFDWATRSGLSDDFPHYSYLLKLRLCEDLGRSMPVCAPISGTFVCAARSTFQGMATLALVFERSACERQIVQVTAQARIRVLPSQSVREGDVVAFDGPENVPADWDALSLQKRWNRVLPKLLPRSRFETWVRLWFERQFVTIRDGFVHVPSNLAALAAKSHAVAEALHWDLAPAMEHYNEAVDAFVFPPLRLKAWQQYTGVLPGEVVFDFTPRDMRFVPPGPPKQRCVSSRSALRLTPRRRDWVVSLSASV